MLALQAAGHQVVTDKAMSDQRPGRTALRTPSGRLVYPGHDLDVFERDHVEAKRHAKMGESLAGVDGRPPIVWPDMQKVAADAKAARPPMTEETKAKLRAHSIEKPRNVGDEIARMLEGKSLPEVYEAAAKYLGEDLKALTAKYAHLNPGQQRMVCGNRMRAKWKAENLNAKTRAKK